MEKDLVDKYLKLLLETRKNTRPETQYLVGLLVTILYLGYLLQANIFPSSMQPLVEFIHQIPNIDLAFVISALFTSGVTIDGMRRIKDESLPFYKAYIQVFLLNKRADQ